MGDVRTKVSRRSVSCQNPTEWLSPLTKLRFCSARPSWPSHIFRLLKLSSILGYVAAGMVIGPWGLRLVSDVPSVMSFAEFGIVLLLFIIGLELQPTRLWVMRRNVFGLGRRR